MDLDESGLEKRILVRDLQLTVRGPEKICLIGQNGSGKTTLIKRIAELSGGQKAKIFLLQMTLSGANVLVLDEPTRNFSPLSGPVIRGMLRDFPGTIISISHDRKYIEEVCDRVYEITEGKLMLKDRE